MKLRIQFSKHGAMKFIGHLDTMRYFQKAFRRAGIDIAYSTGFSPHQIMAFAAPLGVGLESEAEYLDIEAQSITTSADMLKKLNDTMSEGFIIKDIRILPEGSGNAMASVAAASYEVWFRNDFTPGFSLQEAVSRFNSSETVEIVKQTKKSEVKLNLRPYVYELACKEDHLYMTVDASSAGNIKPELVIRALFSFYDEALPQNALHITRLETYGKKEDALIPLIEFGEKF